MAFGKFKSTQRTEETSQDGKPLMLVIDDDITVRQTLEFMLNQKGYDVTLCKDGTDGLRQISSEVMTVILDIKMPGMNGFEVYDHLKTRFPEIPVIFYSAYQNVVEGIEMRRKYQAFSYVDKNGDVQKLFSVIERAVKHRRTMQNLEELMTHVQKVKERR